MQIIHSSEVSIASTPHKVDVRPLFSFEHAAIVKITLKTKESLLPHITPVDAIFYILEGEGTVEIGEESAEVHTGDLIVSPKKIKHRLINPKSADFSFLVIKVPSPGNQKSKIL